mmetsp:Transcript_78033/g.171066  ORF Transcript_78033/g.171066 Transcript_78033/m.171066 type:complete len:777 (-) Transcript_78033:2325-4655(-)
MSVTISTDEPEEVSSIGRAGSRWQLVKSKTRSEVSEPASKVKQRSLKENRDIVCTVLSERGEGSWIRGWRRELDQQGDLEVDFQDFAKCAHRLHFEVNTDLLFGLDDDHSSLTLEELSPQAGILMNRVKTWVKETHGSTQDFFAACDVAMNGRINQDDLMKGFQRGNFEASDEELEMVFECADVSNSGYVQEDDLIFLEAEEEVRAKRAYQARVRRMDRWKYFAAQEYITHVRRFKEAQEGGLRMSRGRKETRPWLEKTFEQLPAAAWYIRQDRERTQMKHATSAVAAFRHHLRTVYGNEIRAFRRALDFNHTYNFTFKTLRRYIQKLNLHLNVYDLWKGLDKDEDDVVRIEELSIKHAFALCSLRNWARQELGGCVAIWDSKPARDASRERTGTWFSEKKMLTAVFIDALDRLGWPGVVNKATRSLAIGALDSVGCGVITKADLEWLDRWNPTEWIAADPDPQALEEFKARLVQLFGHPLAAWRKALDSDDSNRVTWHEFLAVCKRFRFPYAASAWRALDQDCTGSVSIEQFEPYGAELLRSFKEWAEVHYGSIKRCWKAIDTDGVGSVTLGELKRACAKLNWSGDVHLLFACLDIDGQTVGEHLAPSLTWSEVAFLDQWHFGVSLPEVSAEEAREGRRGSWAAQSTSQSKRLHAAKLASVVARLSTPIGFPPEPVQPLHGRSSTSPGRSHMSTSLSLASCAGSPGSSSLPCLRQGSAPTPLIGSPHPKFGKCTSSQGGTDHWRASNHSRHSRGHSNNNNDINNNNIDHKIAVSR